MVSLARTPNAPKTSAPKTALAAASADRPASATDSARLDAGMDAHMDAAEASRSSGSARPALAALTTPVAVAPVRRGLAREATGNTRISPANQRLVDLQSDPLLGSEARASGRAQLFVALRRGDPGVAEALFARAVKPARPGTNWNGGATENILAEASRAGVPSARAPYAQLQTTRALADVEPRRAARLSALLAGPDAEAVRDTLAAREDLPSLEALAASGTADDLDAIAARAGQHDLGNLAVDALRKAGDAGLDAAVHALSMTSGPAHERLKELVLSKASVGALERGDVDVTQALVDVALEPGTIVPSHIFDVLAQARTPAALDGLARLSASSHVGGSAGFALAKLGARGRGAALDEWDNADPATRVALLPTLAPAFGSDPRAEAALFQGAHSPDPKLALACLDAIDRAMGGAAGRDSARRARASAALLDVEALASRNTSTVARADVAAVARRAQLTSLTHALVEERADVYRTLIDGGLADTAEAVARSVGATAGHAAFEEAARNRDAPGVVSGFEHASAGDLALAAARVAPRALGDVIDDVRGVDAAGADRVLDALHARKDPRHDALLGAQLASDADAGRDDVLASFASRHMPAGGPADARAIDALASTKSEAGAAALLDRGAVGSPKDRDAIVAALERSRASAAVDAAAVKRLDGGPASDVAARALRAAGTKAGREVAGVWRAGELTGATAKLENQIARTDGELHAAVKELLTLQWIDGHGVNQQDKLTHDIAAKKARIDEITKEREALAQDVTALLADPAARANLADAPNGVDAFARSARAIAATDAGRRFADEQLAPGLTKPIVDDPLWKRLLHPERAADREVAIGVVETLAVGLTAGGAARFTVAVERVLGVAPGVVTKELAKALLKGPAVEATSPGALARLAAKTQVPLTRITQLASTATAALSLWNAIDDPTAHHIVEAGSGALSAIGSFAKMGSRASVGVNIATSPIDIYEGTEGAVDAFDRGDTARGIGEAARGAGGACRLAGALICTSVVGLPLGCTLIAIGSAVSLVGGLVSSIFGDSDYQKVARERGYM